TLNHQLIVCHADYGLAVDALSGDQPKLAEGPPRAVHRDQSLIDAAVAVEHRHLPDKDRVEFVVLVPFPDEHLSRLGAASLAVRLEFGELVLAQPRERAVAVGGLDDPLGRLAHGS